MGWPLQCRVATLAQVGRASPCELHWRRRAFRYIMPFSPGVSIKYANKYEPRRNRPSHCRCTAGGRQAEQCRARGARRPVALSPCLRRVKRLEHEGYIETYRAMLGRDRIGLGLTVFVGIKIEGHAN